MPLIKSTNTPATVSTFSLADIETHARNILLRASIQAEQLLAVAQTEADLMREQAKQDGHAEGLAAGKREGVAQGLAEGEKLGRQQAFDAESARFAEAVATLTALTHAFDAECDRVLAAAEAEVLPLALAIGRKVTKRMGEIDPAVVHENLRECLRLISGTHEVRIAINPDQNELVKSLMPGVQIAWPQLTHITLVPDDDIAAGGCRVTTAGGEIDADLDRQLDRLVEELVGAATAKP